MSSPILYRRFILTLAIVVFVGMNVPALALQPDEIALIVNQNEPVGGDLARFYAKARQLPDNRILELDLPKSEEMSFKDYEEIVVPQVREFLRTTGVGPAIKCFVTFYGVPLRIAGRVNTPDENRELTDLRQDLLQTAAKAVEPVANLEALARKINPAFQPATGTDLDHLAARATAAERDILGQIQTQSAPTDRAKLGAELFAAVEPLAGDAMKIKRMAIEQALRAATQPADESAVMAAKGEYDRYMQLAAELEQGRYSSKSRNDLRQLVKKHFGLFSYVKLLRDQTDYLNPADTTAAFDSELSLVRWTAYPRARWHNNPLYYADHPPAGPTPVTYMVMRLDAPKPDTVKEIIAASIQVEARGLHGKVVLDSRGLIPGQGNPAERGLAEFDQTIRNLATFLQAHAHVDVVADDKPELLPAHSEDGVALYCGWYSVHQYVPCCAFNPGAVGYHIASYELLSLHTPNERGWVAGLLNDGVAATLGPVAEPYVQAFPRPDDFFPLLLTGRLTLAEVYWRTTPMSSWMLSAIGDPLYTPYKTNPAVEIKDLPARLQPIFLAPPAGR